MKRTRHLRPLTIGLIGASAFALAACKEEAVEASIWRSPDACAAAGDGSLAECTQAWDEAQAAHVETAPRYDALAVCEDQHGAGNCVADNSGGGGGSIFMPLLMGYMMGKMLGGATGAAAARSAKPLYPTAGGQVATADGGTRFSGGQGKVKVPAQSFAAAPKTVGKPPMSAAQVRSTGGFGARGGGSVGG